MKFGYFTLSDNHYADNPRAPNQLVSDIIDEALYAEQLGMHSAWIGEHHFGTLGVLSCPEQYAAQGRRGGGGGGSATYCSRAPGSRVVTPIPTPSIVRRTCTTRPTTTPAKIAPHETRLIRIVWASSPAVGWS